ncbi:MAG: sulfurtransferase TusA family protein [Nitrospirae bacterium]|nr:sulfurtransferase TusA family protein [Magnetococcales bacterium]
MALALLDTLARSGIGRLGVAGGGPGQQGWYDHLQDRICSGNRHTRFDRGPSLEEASGALAQWSASWDAVVDTSGSPTVRRLLGHCCLAEGKRFLSGWVSPGNGWILSLKRLPDQSSPCPGTQHDIDTAPQCLDPALNLLLPGLTGVALAGEILSGLLGFGCKDENFLLHIDAKRVHYGRIRLLGDLSCVLCRGGLLAPSVVSGGGECSVDPGAASAASAASIDITGERCPMTFVRVKLRMESLPQGTRLRVRLTGGDTLENVSLSLANLGHLVEGVTECEGGYELFVRKQR